MTRITVAITKEQQNFIKEQSRVYGNRSGVIRHALDQLRRENMVRDMTEHFASAPRQPKRAGVERLAIKALANLPDY